MYQNQFSLDLRNREEGLTFLEESRVFAKGPEDQINTLVCAQSVKAFHPFLYLDVAVFFPAFAMTGG